MPSLTAKDRAPLCLFSYEHGRRCRTPRIASHPHFCFYHAQKESQAQSAEKLAKELDYFFSGDYLSACDLSTAMGRLIPAVIRGDIKPRLARTVAYMLQTQLQAIHLAQHEYINAFSTDDWRKAVRHSVDLNSDYLCPPNPETKSETQPPQSAPQSLAHTPAQSPAQPAPPTIVEAGLARPGHTNRPAADEVSNPERSEVPCLDPAPSTTDETRPTPAPAEHSEPAATPAAPSPQPASSPQPNDATAALAVARSIFRRRPNNSPANSFRTNIYTSPGNS